VSTQNPETSVEWIIVDSGSTDGTVEYAREIGARLLPFRRAPFNYCAALNAGAAAATGDLWVMSNNDVEFRSAGSLAALQRVFEAWPILAVLSPGRECDGVDLEFQREWIYGPCWAVRPQAFRAWGGMPESVSGYGYDELWTITRCWELSRALGYLTGWSVLHHGSVTFGDTGANTTPAMRRNLSRLLATLGDEDLDVGAELHPVAESLCRRHIAKAPWLLAVGDEWAASLGAQGFANAKLASTGVQPHNVARVLVQGGDPNARQWLPWLANELMLQPDAQVVGADGIYAARPGAAANLAEAVAIGPPPPPLLPPPPSERTSIRQRLGAYLHDWRHRKTQFPEEW
jgi:hypothetical protein